MNIQFKKINDTSKDVQFSVREWRNSPEVSKYFIIPSITLEQHTKWLDGQHKNGQDMAYVVYYNDNPAGCAYFRRINLVHNTAEWGIFLNPNSIIKGLGAIIEYKMHEIAFTELGLFKLNIEVVETNIEVLLMHQKFGYVQEGVLRKNIQKGPDRLDVVLLGLFAEDWNLRKHKLSYIVSNFEM